MDDLEDELDSVETAVRDVERAVGRVETAINNKWSTVQAIVGIFIAAGLWALVGDMWHSKWRYALSNSVETDKVLVDDTPHDCAFLAAPLGEKYCHYVSDM